jgi:response regulator NasT
MRQLIIAFPDQTLALKVKSLLQTQGLSVSAVCNSASQVLQSVDRFSGGGVVLCPWLLPDCSAGSLIDLLPEDYDVLAIHTSRNGIPALRAGLYTLPQPFQTSVLAESLRQLLATRRIEYSALHKDQTAVKTNRSAVSDLNASEMGKKTKPQSKASVQRSQEEQKLIEQAKYTIMNRKRLTEEQAHRYLQKRSMETGVRLADLARSILQI